MRAGARRSHRGGRVVHAVDLPDGEVVRGAPPRPPERADQGSRYDAGRGWSSGSRPCSPASTSTAPEDRAVLHVALRVPPATISPAWPRCGPQVSARCPHLAIIDGKRCNVVDGTTRALTCWVSRCSWPRERYSRPWYRQARLQRYAMKALDPNGPRRTGDDAAKPIVPGGRTTVRVISGSGVGAPRGEA